MKYDNHNSLVWSNELDMNKNYLGREKHTDLKRFLIELNQINALKISDNIEMNYSLLKNHLTSNVYKEEKLKYSEWNLIGLLYNVSLQIDAMSNDDYYTDNQISYIAKSIEEIQQLIKYRVDDKSYSVNIDFAFNYLKQKTLKYKELHNGYFTSLMSNINKIEKWYNKDYQKYPVYIFFESNDKFLKYIKLNNRIDIKGFKDMGKNDIIKNISYVLDLSLPVFLKNNDEPVWTNYDDTLGVMNWALDSLDNMAFNCIDKISPFEIKNDHQNAKLLAEGLNDIKNINIELDKIYSNIVYFKLKEPSLDISSKLVKLMEDRKILFFEVSPNRYRLVTHYGIDSKDIESVLINFNEIL